MAEEGVNYSVKELLARQDVKLDILLGDVSKKADATAVDALRLIVEGVAERFGKRIGDLETGQEVQRAVSRNTRWIVFTAIPATAGLATLINKLIS